MRPFPGRERDVTSLPGLLTGVNGIAQLFRVPTPFFFGSANGPGGLVEARMGRGSHYPGGWGSSGASTGQRGPAQTRRKRRPPAAGTLSRVTIWAGLSFWAGLSSWAGVGWCSWLLAGPGCCCCSCSSAPQGPAARRAPRASARLAEEVRSSSSAWTTSTSKRKSPRSGIWSEDYEVVVKELR